MKMLGLLIGVAMFAGMSQGAENLRVFGKVSVNCRSCDAGEVSILECETPTKARMVASKFLTDISFFGDDAKRFAVGHDGARAVVVYSPEGSPKLPPDCEAVAPGEYPLWLDWFDNRPISMGQSGWGHIPTNYLGSLEWTAKQGFNMISANYVTYDSWAAPGVWNHSVNDAIAARAKKLGVGYLDYPLCAHPENPAWYWNAVPLPYAVGKDGAIAPTSFDYFKFAANGSDWPMPKIEPLIAFCNQECSRHYARDDHFVAHFGTPEMGMGQAATLPGYVGDEPGDTMREIVGFRSGESLDLRGEWTMYCGGECLGRVDSGDPILLAWKRHPDGFRLERSFVATGDMNRYKYLHIACGNWHGVLSKFGTVRVNGVAARDLTVRKPLVGDLDNCYEVGNLLKEGKNEISIEGLKGPLGFYAFLGADGRFEYPSTDEAKNQAFFDLSERAARKVVEYTERRMRAHRAGDAAGRPQFAMCHTHIGDLDFDVLHRYAGCQHDTGQTQGVWAPWCARYWTTRGDPVSCENGGVPRTVERMRGMFTRYLMLGVDAVNLLFDPNMFRRDGKGEWIEDHRAWLNCLAKNDRERFDICVMRSIRNASRLCDTHPWRLDPSRGVLQAAGRVPGLVDPSDVVSGRVRDWATFLMDAGTTIMTEDEAKAVAGFIRGGGTFIANEHTGRHSNLRRDCWPLMAALGLPPGPVLKGGGEAVNFREFKVGEGRIVFLSSDAWWRTSDDGRKFNFEDPRQIPALGAMLDELGVPRSSGGAQLPGMRDCFAETWRSKNGLYDLYLLAHMTGTNTVVASPVFHAREKIDRLVEMSAEGHPEREFTQDAENRIMLKDVSLLPGESRVYASLRRDAGQAPKYWIKSLERRLYALEDVPQAEKPAVAAEAERNVLPLTDGWRYVEGGRGVRLGTYVTMGIDDDNATASFAKEFTVPPEWKGRRVTLVFESQGYITGFYPHAVLSVNGKVVKRQGNGSVRIPIPDEGNVRLDLVVDGSQGTKQRRMCPSGFCGVVYAETRPIPRETIALDNFRHGLAGSLEISFATPEGSRISLVSEQKIGTVLLNGVMLEVLPSMGSVDVTGILAPAGSDNVLRWWPNKRNPTWETKAPGSVPPLCLEVL